MGKPVSYNQISEWTGKSYRTVKKKLETAGVKPISRDGNGIVFDSVEVLDALFAQRIEGGSDLDLNQEKALLAVQQRRKLERENDISEGLVAPREHLTYALSYVGRQMMAHVEALPLQMKRANPLLTGHDIMVVKKCISKMCDAIREIKLSDAD